MRNRLAARPGCSLGFWGEAPPRGERRARARRYSYPKERGLVLPLVCLFLQGRDPAPGTSVPSSLPRSCRVADLPGGLAGGEEESRMQGSLSFPAAKWAFGSVKPGGFRNMLSKAYGRALQSWPAYSVPSDANVVLNTKGRSCGGCELKGTCVRMNSVQF